MPNDSPPDLVSELRAVAAIGEPAQTCALLLKAADEIERLRGKLGAVSDDPSFTEIAEGRTTRPKGWLSEEWISNPTSTETGVRERE